MSDCCVNVPVHVSPVDENYKLQSCIVLNKHNTVFARSGPLYATGVFPGPTRVVDANVISIALAVFAGLTRWQTDWDRPTDHATRSVTIGGAHSCKTRRVAVYVETHYNIASKRAFPTGIPKRWQLFTYLLTHKLFSSCIRRYLVSRAWDWVMPALSAVLLTFSFQFSLLFCTLTQFRVILLDDMAVIWRRNQATVHTLRYRKRALILAGNVFLYAAYIPGERLLTDSDFKNGNKGDHLAMSFGHL